MTDPDIDSLVKIVRDGLQQKEGEREIVGKLMAAGVPAKKAPTLFHAIKTEMQRGVQSVVIPQTHEPPDDPLLLAAYRAGRSAMRGSVRVVWARSLAPIGVALALLLIAAWLVFRTL